MFRDQKQLQKVKNRVSGGNEPTALAASVLVYKEQSWLGKPSNVFGNTARAARECGCSETSGKAIHSFNGFITPALRCFPE